MLTKTPLAPKKWDFIRQDASCAILQPVHEGSDISISEIPRQLGVSHGMVHYVVHSLIDKGSVKVKKFSQNPNKRNYSYILTPAGLSEKLQLMSVFLDGKRKEYYALQQEISALDQSIEVNDFSAEN